MPLFKHWVNQVTRTFRSRPSQSKTLAAYKPLAAPAWTPRAYDQLAQDGYQKNIIVYRAVNLLARSAASVRWQLYKQQHEIIKHPALELINKPNSLQARSNFIESVTAYLLLAGNSYIEAIRHANGHIMELRPLRPDRVRVIPDAAQVVQAYTYTNMYNQRTIPAADVLHLRYFHPLNDWYGLSPIEAAALSIDQHTSVSKHNLALLQNGGRPSGVMIYRGEHPLNEQDRDYLRHQFRSVYQATHNAGQVMFLDGDFEWKEIAHSLADMNYLDGKNMSAREIAQAYGIPPMLVGVTGDATFANYREARLHLWEDTILPLLDSIILQMNRWLLPSFENGLRFRYAIDSIPALVARREGVWERLNQADFLTINEKRRAVGYPPVSGGDMIPNLKNEIAHDAK
jgi:HK97 family phage portal protein